MKSMENLQLFHQAGNLKKIKRTGWKNNKIESPESVAEHSFRVSFIAMFLAKDLNVDALRLIQMSLIHDLAESIVGDIIPHGGIRVQEKHVCEEKALRKLFKNIDNKDYWIGLWLEYEEQKTAEAIALKNIDKFEMALQATEYSSGDRDKNLSSFFINAKNNITLSVIQRLMDALANNIELK